METTTIAQTLHEPTTETSPRVQALDSLLVLVLELNEAIGPVAGDKALIPNLPVLILAHLETEGERTRREVEMMLSALGVNGRATVEMLESRGLVARVSNGAVDAGDDELRLTETGSDLVRRMARAFSDRLRDVRETVGKLAELLES